MELRYATIEDADMLSSFAGKTFYDTYAWYNDEQDMTAYINESFSSAQIAAEIADPKSAFLLALDAGNLRGYAKLVWRNRPDAASSTGIALEIARLYAGKDFIGKGIGKMLVEACIDYAKKGNASSMWLDVWKENTKAIRFYESRGFKIVCDWHFQLGKDLQHDFIMQKNL